MVVTDRKAATVDGLATVARARTRGAAARGTRQRSREHCGGTEREKEDGNRSGEGHKTRGGVCGKEAFFVVLLLTWKDGGDKKYGAEMEMSFPLSLALLIFNLVGIDK